MRLRGGSPRNRDRRSSERSRVARCFARLRAGTPRDEDAPTPAVVIYLNADGGTFRPGADDARVAASSLVAETSRIPAWTVPADDWRTVKTCIADELAPFDMIVTDRDPGDVPHDEIVIGGAPV